MVVGVTEEILYREKTTVKKSNSLLLTKMSKSLSINQLRIFSMAILKTQKVYDTDDGINRAIGTFRTKEFRDIYDIEKIRWSSILEDCVELSKLSIKIEQQGVYTIFNPFHKITANKNLGTITFEWHEDMLKEITDLKRIYGMIDLNILASLRSSYSWRMYEYLVGLNKKGLRYFSAEIEKEELYEVFDTEGKYKNPSSFKSRVLDVAQEELNENTDISITNIETKRNGRKVYGYFIEWERKGKVYAVDKEDVREYHTLMTNSAMSYMMEVGSLGINNEYTQAVFKGVTMLNGKLADIKIEEMANSTFDDIKSEIKGIDDEIKRLMVLCNTSVIEKKHEERMQNRIQNTEVIRADIPSPQKAPFYNWLEEREEEK